MDMLNYIEDFQKNMVNMNESLKPSSEIPSSSFKLPIEYISHSEINETILNDLEMNHEKSIYQHLLSSSKLDNLDNKSNILDKWIKYYTTDKHFLKDTQKIIKRFDKKNLSNTDFNSFKQEYIEFKSETSFFDKYQYIGFNFLKPLNYSPLFLHFLSLYNLGSPLLALLSPLVILIVPFIVIKIKGYSITIENYIEFLKHSLSENKIFKGLTNFNELDSQKKISGIFTIIFYIIQIYSNVVSCIKFYKNIYSITAFIEKYKTNIMNYRDIMSKTMIHIYKYPSYRHFYNDLKERRDSLDKTINKLNTVIYSDNIFVKLSQIGLIMNVYYEIFIDNIHHQNMTYAFDLCQYINDLGYISTFVKNKKINKCKFGKKTIIKDGYYLPYINESFKTNDIELSKNILITGPNAAGKTTIIKSLLINTILSQQIGFGCYKHAVISLYDIFHSYLNIPDTSGRDSLFQAEARRCKDILDCITENPSKKHLCIFDEIYSGTNPNDAVMCANLYLKYMNKNKQNVDYVITTHYIQMCESFEKDISEKSKNVINMKMDVIVNDDSIQYLYKLVKGISYVHGGKYVLKQLKYPDYLFE
jgi:hypothetical protein